MRDSDLVVPLAHEATAMRTTDTTHQGGAWSGAVSQLIGASLRQGDVDSTNGRSTRRTPITPGRRNSTTATRTTTTRTTSSGSASSADEKQHADFSLADLVAAHLDCRQFKRNTSACQEFERDLGPNLCQLYEEIVSGEYRPGRSICFIITWPKVREVWAAPYRDRIVHHLLYMKVGERFTNSFIVDSCACIQDRGTMYAAGRLEAKIRSITENWTKPAHYLKCDVSNFFVSINKHILRELLARKIHEPFWLDLAEKILYHDPRTDVQVNAKRSELAMVPAYKSLFNQSAHVGLPIGNLSSQFFANVYLDVLDQHAKHYLQAKHYIRYVDDFVFLDRSTEWLNWAWADVDAFLPATLGIRLNPKKTIIQPVARGVDFVGQVIKPYRRQIRKRTANEALRRMAEAPADALLEIANSYFGLHRQATHSHRARAKVARLLLSLGHTVDKALTKTFKKAT